MNYCFHRIGIYDEHFSMISTSEFKKNYFRLIDTISNNIKNYIYELKITYEYQILNCQKKLTKKSFIIPALFYFLFINGYNIHLFQAKKKHLLMYYVLRTFRK